MAVLPLLLIFLILVITWFSYVYKVNLDYVFKPPPATKSLLSVGEQETV